MPEPFVRHFSVDTRHGRLEVATVVMDQVDFDALVDELVAVKMRAGLDTATATAVKKAGHIPLIRRGTKTEFVFERYSVQCDLMSIIVRGRGPELLQSFLPRPENN